MRILVVEDDADSGALLEAALGGNGHEVELAQDGVTGLRAARARRPDLIVSDILMPEMDGFALCRAVKGDPELRDVPFVFYTATYIDPRDEELALALGASRFLVKPMEPVHFLAAIQAVLDQHRRGELSPPKAPAESGERLEQMHASRVAAKLDKKLRELEAERRAVTEKEAWLRSVLRAAPSGILCFFKGTPTTEITPEAERVLGPEWRPRVEAEGFEVLFAQMPTPSAFRRALGGEPIRDLEAVLPSPGAGDRLVLWNLERIVGSDGAPVGVVAVVRDVTAARSADRERAALQEQLAKAEHLEAIGRLAAGAAHDFNNLLTPILSCSEMICLSGDADARSRRWARQILDAAERASELTRQFLAFSRKQVLEVQQLDVNEVIGAFQNLLRRIVREDVEVELCLAPGLRAVRADRSQLEQVVMNLAMNAADAMPQGGRVRIETADIVLDTAAAAAFPGAKPGAYVLLTVSDTGAGMEPAVLARVFEPFFTTKEVGKGTGLGLATVYGVVKQHGGHVTVESEPGAGTTFRVLLPVEAGPAEAYAGLDAHEERGGTETVLVVEDQEAVRFVVCEALERAGYRVVPASGAAEALEAARRLAELHLLLTDVVMPGVDGIELGRVLGTGRPGLKVLYMSAYAADAVSPHGALGPSAAFLQKPFRPEALLRKVRAVLDGRTEDAP